MGDDVGGDGATTLWASMKAATKRDERGDTANNMVTHNNEREGRHTDDVDDDHE